MSPTICHTHTNGLCGQGCERSLLACVDLVGDAIYNSVVPFVLVTAVILMVNNVLYQKSSRAACSIQADYQQSILIAGTSLANT